MSRDDLVLALVALAGLAAGLVLTIAKYLGITGPVLLSVGIVAAVAAVVPGARDEVCRVLNRQHLQDESLKAILHVAVQPVTMVDPFEIGVFRSDLAEEARGDQFDPEKRRSAVPPYVPRDVDSALRRALDESSLVRSKRLVVLRGDPKSGKSRSLWEAARQLPGRNLLVVKQPDKDADKNDPTYRPLITLAHLDRPVSHSKGRDLVIWVDDAHEHLGRGLNTRTLSMLAESYPAGIIAMTIHSSALDAWRKRDKSLYDLLLDPRRWSGRGGAALYPDLILDQKFSQAELDKARVAYPSLADRPDLDRLPELFASVPILIDRYRHNKDKEPVGVAVVQAVIDWERAGMPPGSIDEPTLREMTELTLQDFAPNRILDDEAFRSGLEWAVTEIAAYAALVIRIDPRGHAKGRRFRGFDAAVSWADQKKLQLVPGTWDFVLAHASNLDCLDVGWAAYDAHVLGAAVTAFDRAASCTTPLVLAQALIYKGVALHELGRTDDALAAWEQVIEKFAASHDQALAQRVKAAQDLAAQPPGYAHQGLMPVRTRAGEPVCARNVESSHWPATTCCVSFDELAAPQSWADQPEDNHAETTRQP